MQYRREGQTKLLEGYLIQFPMAIVVTPSWTYIATIEAEEAIASSLLPKFAAPPALLAA